MNILITTTAFTALFCGAAFAQSSDIAHEAHRFVNNASAVSHVNSSTHENLPDMSPILLCRNLFQSR